MLPLVTAGAATQSGAMVPIVSGIAPGNANIELVNIPQGYQDLMLVINGKTSRSDAFDDFFIHWGFVGEYSHTLLSGNGSTISSSRAAINSGSVFPAAVINGNNPTTTPFSTIIVHILNYSNTSTFKTALISIASDRNGSGGTHMVAGLRRNTAAVSLLVFGGGAASFISGSTYTLYGIRRVGQ